MTGLILLLAGLQVGADTVTLDVGTALRRGLEVSPTLAAARYRVDAASERVAQARAWPNPALGVAAENVGQQRAFTGTGGTAGLEGQAVLEAPLLLGAQRSGPIGLATAEHRVLLAGSEASAARTEVELLGSIGAYLRDQILTETAREEVETLSRIAQDLALQAEVGRAARGDAARAELARGMAATRLARREASVGTRGAELARSLGYPPSTTVRIAGELCSSPDLALSLPASSTPAELELAGARLEVATGAVALATGLKLPRISPQVGVRRSGGKTGLYLGLQSSLPLFDRGSRAVEAARSDERAALAELQDVEARWDAAGSAARLTLDALEQAGSLFDAQWFRAVDETVAAAEARFDLGESTLAQLLDSRRARLQALEDYAAWQAEWWETRTQLVWLSGARLDPSLLCLDPYRSGER